MIISVAFQDISSGIILALYSFATCESAIFQIPSFAHGSGIVTPKLRGLHEETGSAIILQREDSWSEVDAVAIGEYGAVCRRWPRNRPGGLSELCCLTWRVQEITRLAVHQLEDSACCIEEFEQSPKGSSAKGTCHEGRSTTFL